MLQTIKKSMLYTVIQAFGSDLTVYRAVKSHALSVRLTQTNSILRSHTETIISHAFEIPCSFSEVPL